MRRPPPHRSPCAAALNAATAATALVAAMIVVLAAPPAAAHVAPSERDNNRYLLVAPLADRVRLAYTVYMGQEPGRRARPRMDTDHDGAISEAEASAYGRQLAAQVLPHLSLEVDGQPVAIEWQDIDVGGLGRRLCGRPGRVDLPRPAARATLAPGPPPRSVSHPGSRRDRAARRGEPRAAHHPLGPGRPRERPPVGGAPRLPLDGRAGPGREPGLPHGVRGRPVARHLRRRRVHRRQRRGTGRTRPARVATRRRRPRGARPRYARGSPAQKMNG